MSSRPQAEGCEADDGEPDLDKDDLKEAAGRGQVDARSSVLKVLATSGDWASWVGEGLAGGCHHQPEEP